MTSRLVCAIAAIGFAFDIYEILMLPLIVRPALLELTGAAPGSPEFQMWVGRLFYIPAFAGGIFGLIGGYLTDRFGRRRVLTYSILIYAFAAFASGYATSVQMLLVLRCFVFIGVCVEFVAAIAWLAELFPDPKRREKVLGWTFSFSLPIPGGDSSDYARVNPAPRMPIEPGGTTIPVAPAIRPDAALLHAQDELQARADAAIAALQLSPAPDLLQLQRLKKRKLMLKDQITRLESELIPDLNA